MFPRVRGTLAILVPAPGALETTAIARLPSKTGGGVVSYDSGMRIHVWHVIWSAMICAVALAAGAQGASADFLSAGSYDSTSNVFAQPAVTLPALGGTYVDPVFGTTVERLTQTPEPTGGDVVGTVPEYAKAQAWNADMSRLLLRGTDASWHMYNGATFAGPLPLSLPIGDIEPRWSPTNPDRLTYILGTRTWRYSVSQRRSWVIGNYPRIGTLTSGAEQEVSRSGRYFAVHGQERYDSHNHFVSTRAAVVDLYNGRRTKIVKLRRPAGNVDDFLDYIAIVPSGKLVIVMWAYRGADVYTRNWRYVGRLTTWDEHGDFCRDSAGRWWFVQAHYRPGPNDEVVQASSLIGLPRRTLWMAPRYNMAVHISCRNTALPGWAFVSSYWDGIGQRPVGTDTAFENEIFALSLNSTSSAPIVRRLAHTRMEERSDYWDEPHATVRQDGRVVLFASNFAQYVEDENYNDTYAVDLR